MTKNDRVFDARRAISELMRLKGMAPEGASGIKLCAGHLAAFAGDENSGAIAAAKAIGVSRQLGTTTSQVMKQALDFLRFDTICPHHRLCYRIVEQVDESGVAITSEHGSSFFTKHGRDETVLRGGEAQRDRRDC